MPHLTFIWNHTPGHAFEQLSVYDARVTNYSDPEAHIHEGVSEIESLHPELTDNIYLYTKFGALDVGDNVMYRWLNPNGEVEDVDSYDMTFLRSIHADVRIDADAN